MNEHHLLQKSAFWALSGFLIICVFFAEPTGAQSPKLAADEQLVAIDSALSHKPHDLTLLVKKANRLGEIGNFSEELTVANEIISRFPMQRHGYYSLMEAQNGLGNFSAALNAVDKMMTVAPPQEKDYIFRCSLLSQNGRFSEALSDCNRALKSFPDKANLYLVRARCFYRMKGPCDEAINDMRKACLLAPSDQSFKKLLSKIESEKNARK